MNNFSKGYYNPYECSKDCENRSVTCHAECERYKKFLEYNEMTKENRRKYQESINITTQSVIDVKKRTMNRK